MQISRKEFGLGLVAAALGSAATARAAEAATDGDSVPTTPSAANQKLYFFKHSSFEFVLLNTLGRAYNQGGDVGRVLYLMRQIEDGNFESAFTVLKGAGDEASALAEQSLAKGHKESARQAYLWAQNFYDSAVYFADGSDDPSRIEPTWDLLYDCWLKSIPLFDPPIEPVSIPYEGTELRGFYFRGKSTAPKRPLLILVNGSDGSLLDMWTEGAQGATARGYDCLTFDGPGQGYALWKQKLYFRPDWEKVITPVVDYALARGDVDPKRIAVQGISQGGYWVPRAAAFEKRIAAVIADPGVVDVSTSWTASLPPPMIQLLKNGPKAAFDGYMDKSLSPAAKADLRFRMRPFGFDSYYDTFRATMDYSLKEVAGQISCPVLITAPANEAFWPGQSQQLSDLLTSPKTLVSFTEADGGDLHCEPGAHGLRDLRVFDWLDEVFA
jgi:dienelactone hydrolase